MGISIRAYGRHRGVPEAAVRKAIKSGRISKASDGTIDPVKADAQWLKNTDVGQQREPKRKAVSTAAIDAVNDTLHEHSGSGGGTTYMQARTANEVLKAQTNRIRLQQIKKELVDRSSALAHVFKLALSERDAWVSWPARISSQMAAELDVDAHTMHVTLEAYVRQHLSELADVQPRVD